MINRNSLMIIAASATIFFALSCQQNTTKETPCPEVENASVTDTIVIRDTVLVAQADSVDNLNSVTSACISSSKTNIIYKGIDNPLTIKVPGAQEEDIVVEISNGTIQKEEGENYIVQVKQGNIAKISVSIKESDGEVREIDKFEFRVKTVPNPQPYFAGKGVIDDRVKKSELVAAQGVFARMDNFEFDIKFEVVSFRMTVMAGGTPFEKGSSSNRITGDMRTMLNKVKPGTKVYIENIKAKAPDGTVRNLGTIALKVT